MTLVICPGIHPPHLSDRFTAALMRQLEVRRSSLSVERAIAAPLVFPTDKYAPFDGGAVSGYLQRKCDPQESLILIGFSAGVVGAIAAAQVWSAQGHSVAALIAVDGWGMPKFGTFPFYRVSHDAFTHWSSAFLGAGDESFYADPAVSHLDLWQFPEQAYGYRTSGSEGRPLKKMTALSFIAEKIDSIG